MVRSCFRLVLALGLLIAAARPAPAQDKEWTEPFPPFRIIGNIYWVGSYDLSTYLVTTPAGNILINTGIGDTAQQIASSVAQLGFRIGDTKILTVTHGHFDHAFGLAELKRMTGARVLVPERDRTLLETGGQTDFAFGANPRFHFPPVRVDGTLKDGDTISLGGTTLVAHRHAGHTEGATSFTVDVQEGGKRYRVIIANMPSINPGVRLVDRPSYPGIADDYARTFMALKDMKVDVFLASHASQFKLHEKYKPGDPYDAQRFVDPQGLVTAVRALEKAYLDQVAKERAPKK